MFPLCGIVYTMKYRSHAILYRHSGAPLGGPALPNSAGARQPHHWLSPGRRHPVISVLCSHPTSNQTSRCSRPWYALFIRPPGHTSGQPGSVSVNIAARWTRINNSVLRVTVRSRQRRLQGHFWGFCGSLLSSAPNETPLCETRRAENQIMASRAHMVQASTSSSLFCWQTK